MKTTPTKPAPTPEAKAKAAAKRAAVNYSQRIFYLLVGIVVASAIAALVFFVFVVPVKHHRDEINEHNEQNDRVARALVEHDRMTGG